MANGLPAPLRDLLGVTVALAGQGETQYPLSLPGGKEITLWAAWPDLLVGLMPEGFDQGMAEKVRRQTGWNLFPFPWPVPKKSVDLLNFLNTLRSLALAQRSSTNVAKSMAEDKFIARVYAMGCPEALRSVPVKDRVTQRTIARPDALWLIDTATGEAVLDQQHAEGKVEIIAAFYDGDYWHGGKERSKALAESDTEEREKQLSTIGAKDRRQDNELTAAGVTVFRFSDAAGEYSLNNDDGFERAASTIARRVLEVQLDARHAASASTKASTYTSPAPVSAAPVPAATTPFVDDSDDLDDDLAGHKQEVEPETEDDELNEDDDGNDDDVYGDYAEDGKEEADGDIEEDEDTDDTDNNSADSNDKDYEGEDDGNDDVDDDEGDQNTEDEDDDDIYVDDGNEAPSELGQDNNTNTYSEQPAPDETTTPESVLDAQTMGGLFGDD